MENIHSDLADDTFVVKWPQWLRWCLVLPASVLGCLVASSGYLLLIWISGWFMGNDPSDGFWFQLVSSAIFGGVFVFAGTWMAPRHQFIVSIVLMILLSMISAILFLFSFSPYSSMGPISYGIHTLAILIAGGAVVFHLKDHKN